MEHVNKSTSIHRQLERTRQFMLVVKLNDINFLQSPTMASAINSIPGAKSHTFEMESETVTGQQISFLFTSNRLSTRPHPLPPLLLKQLYNNDGI